MKLWKILVFIVAIAISIPLLCVVADRMTVPAYGGDSVVFIEHLSQSRGKMVNGTYDAPVLSGKSYAYDAYGRILEGSCLDVNGTLLAVVGDSDSLAQDAGSGTDSLAYGIYALPETAGGMTVNKISPDGTVSLTYNGSDIMLSPGERWETVSTDTVCMQNYTLLMTRSDAIRNEGLISKTAIR